jgi:hypothetical protein
MATMSDDDDWRFLPLTTTATLRSELREAGFVVDTIGSLEATGEQIVTVSGPRLWIDALRDWQASHFAGLTIFEYLTKLFGNEHHAALVTSALRQEDG